MPVVVDLTVPDNVTDKLYTKIKQSELAGKRPFKCNVCLKHFRCRKVSERKAHLLSAHPETLNIKIAKEEINSRKILKNGKINLQKLPPKVKTPVFKDQAPKSLLRTPTKDEWIDYAAELIFNAAYLPANYVVNKMSIPKKEKGSKSGIEFKNLCPKTVNKYLKSSKNYAVQYTLREVFKGPELFVGVDKWGKRPIHVVSVNGLKVKDVRRNGTRTQELVREEFIFGGFTSGASFKEEYADLYKFIVLTIEKISGKRVCGIIGDSEGSSQHDRMNTVMRWLKNRSSEEYGYSRFYITWPVLKLVF